VERVTFHQPGSSQPYAVKQAEFFDGLAGILGATGKKTATGAHQRRKDHLIEPQYDQSELFDDPILSDSLAARR
jgi:hypothetical protein